MKIAILGLGKQGVSAIKYWQKQGHEITVCDQNQALSVPQGIKGRLGNDHLSSLDQFDLIVRSPVVHPANIVKANNEAILKKVITVTNEFMRVCPSRNIIGVTGTKGKGTTSSLIAKMLDMAGFKTHLGGNIGTPPLDLLDHGISPEDWVILELANFQLIDLKYSPPIAVCVMVEAEHMDWHRDTAEYFEAKKQLFKHQTQDDVAIYYAQNANSEQIASTSVGRKIPYMKAPGAVVINDNVVIGGQVICSTGEIKLPGRHNWQNVCAATTAVWQITQDKKALRQAVMNFAGLPFRIEFRGEKNGIRFYNDSFATAPGAMIAALNAVDGMKVMIIGGFDRGNDLTELTNSLKEKQAEIRKVVLVGASARRIADELNKASFDKYQLCPAKTMAEIVSAATQSANSGDAVILSPGFASFDMFKNFEDRGHQFNQAIKAV